MTALLERAVAATGPAYEVAEEALLRAGAPPADLGVFAGSADPFVQVLVASLRAWRGSRPRGHVVALEYLAGIEARMGPTAAGSPSPLGVANDLRLRVGAAAVDLLALRLVKATHWPRWKRFGALLYLSEQKLPVATPALLRFAVETADEEARAVAVEAVRATGDPELAQRMTAEERHQTALGRRGQLASVWKAITR